MLHVHKIIYIYYKNYVCLKNRLYFINNYDDIYNSEVYICNKQSLKYQMHFRLRELASPSNPPLYPNFDISDDILSQSLSCFAKYVKSKYISSYSVTCNVKDCYTCDNS